MPSLGVRSPWTKYLIINGYNLLLNNYIGTYICLLKPSSAGKLNKNNIKSNKIKIKLLTLNYIIRSMQFFSKRVFCFQKS